MTTLGTGAASLDILFQIGSYRAIVFDFGVDMSTYTYEFVLKKFKGDRVKTLSLTLGNGVSFVVYSSDQIKVVITSAQSQIEEGEYYYELRRTDIPSCLVGGLAYFSYDSPPADSDTPLSLTVTSQTVNL